MCPWFCGSFHVVRLFNGYFKVPSVFHVLVSPIGSKIYHGFLINLPFANGLCHCIMMCGSEFLLTYCEANWLLYVNNVCQD